MINISSVFLRFLPRVWVFSLLDTKLLSDINSLSLLQLLLHLHNGDLKRVHSVLNALVESLVILLQILHSKRIRIQVIISRVDAEERANDESDGFTDANHNDNKDQPHNYSSLANKPDLSMRAEPEMTAMFCFLRSKRVRSLRR